MCTTPQLWGEQTNLALKHFAVGTERLSCEFIHDYARLKLACAKANHELNLLTAKQLQLITTAAEKITAGKLDQHFPLTIWQSGSGTQTNMNLNEVITNYANQTAAQPIHPNDHVNLSQSSNDTFISVIHITAYKLISTKLLPALNNLHDSLQHKQQQFRGIKKIGRTHLQDAVPLTLGDEFSAFVSQLDYAIKNIKTSSEDLTNLAIGGTAVGSGLNAPQNFDKLTIKYLNELTNLNFKPAANKFAAISNNQIVVNVSSTLRNLALTLMKIANDIRWLASGPRSGLGELILSANEPGSSIMPGKVNPTQCEMLLQICLQVIGNDTSIAQAESQSNLQLNTARPMVAYNLMQAISLLAGGVDLFSKYAINDLAVNQQKIAENRNNSLMLVTALTPVIGYDKAAEIAQLAHRENLTIKAACLKLGYLNAAEFEQHIK